MSPGPDTRFRFRVKTWVALLVLVFAGTDGQGQHQAANGSLPGIQVQFQDRESLLSGQINLIEQQTGFRFSYSDSKINTGVVLRLNKSEMTLAEWGAILKNQLAIEVVLIGSVLILSPVEPPVFVLSGSVVDDVTGERLQGTTIRTGSQLATTNSFGYFFIKTQNSVCRLVFSYTGYQTLDTVITVGDKLYLSIRLFPKDIPLDESTVLGSRLPEGIEVRTGPLFQTREQLEGASSFFGETDVLKTLTRYPGVQSAIDGTINLSVRGGAPDQNMILLDDAPVYNPAHIFGFFSVFNPDAVQSVSFYKNHLPARFGGRISSATDIRMKEGNSESCHGGAGLGVISTRAFAEGPLPGAGSFILSGRYSNLGSLIDGVAEILDKTAGKELTADFSAGNVIRFYDVNGKLNFPVNPNNRILVSVYTGQDQFSFSRVMNSNLMEWGNTAFSLRWNFIPAPALFMNTTGYFSEYRYGSETGTGNEKYWWKARMSETGIKTDADWFKSGTSRISFGGQISYHFLRPGSLIPDSDHPTLSRFSFETKNALGYAGYLQSDHHLSPWLFLSAGVRLAGFTSQGLQAEQGDQDMAGQTTESAAARTYTYWVPEPRLAVTLESLVPGTISASYNRTAQFQHLVNSSLSNLPTDIWIHSSNKVKPVTGDLFSLGYFTILNQTELEFSADFFYRMFTGVTDFTESQGIFKNRDPEGSMKTGSGLSKGIELSLSKPAGRISGWVSYTLSRSTVSIAGINDGHSYPSGNDRRNLLSSGLNWETVPTVKLSAWFFYMTGNRITTPTGYFTLGRQVYQLYSRRNNYQLPAVHRLDLMITWRPGMNSGQKIDWEINAGVYNVYNRKNIMSVYPDLQSDLEKSKLSYSYFFGVLPFLALSLRF